MDNAHRLVDLPIVVGIMGLVSLAILVGYKLGENSGFSLGFSKGRERNEKDIDDGLERMAKMKKFMDNQKEK